MLGGRRHSFNTGGKEIDKMLWDSPPVGSLQSSVPLSNGQPQRSDGEGKQKTTAVKYHAHLQEDDEVPGSPVELCDIAVLKITDATTTSVGPSLTTIHADVTADSSVTSPPSTPPASVHAAPSEEDDRRLRRWLDLCHCERHLIAIKVFYFTFIGALGVAIAFTVVFLKQLGLSAFQIGIISGVRPVLGFVSAPVWGSIADRYNIRRILMLFSMFAWLAFYSGLYFVPAPARRSGFYDDGHAVEQISNVTEFFTTTTVTLNGSATSGTLVDVALDITHHNSSTAATTYV